MPWWLHSHIKPPELHSPCNVSRTATRDHQPWTTTQEAFPETHWSDPLSESYRRCNDHPNPCCLIYVGYPPLTHLFAVPHSSIPLRQITCLRTSIAPGYHSRFQSLFCSQHTCVSVFAPDSSSTQLDSTRYHSQSYCCESSFAKHVKASMDLHPDSPSSMTELSFADLTRLNSASVTVVWTVGLGLPHHQPQPTAIPPDHYWMVHTQRGIREDRNVRLLCSKAAVPYRSCLSLFSFINCKECHHNTCGSPPKRSGIHWQISNPPEVYFLCLWLPFQRYPSFPLSSLLAILCPTYSANWYLKLDPFGFIGPSSVT